MTEENAVAVQEQPAIAGASEVMAVIERAATDPNVDIEKMERLLSLHERILSRNAEQAFNEAMMQAQKEMPAVVRDAENTHTRSRYARLETILEKVKPVIAKHGFSMSFGTDDSPLEGHYRIVCTVSHTGGHSRVYSADIPADLTGAKGTANKNATQGFGSTMSYGRRYLTLLIFDIALTDEDDDAATASGTITDEQLTSLQELIAEVGADPAKFCGYMKVQALKEIPASDYPRAVKALEAKKAQANDPA